MPTLPVQGQEVEVIPRLNNLSIIDPGNCDARKLDGSLSRSPSHELSFVLTTDRATRSDSVTFGNHVLDNDRYVWEGLAEHFVKRSVASRTSNGIRGIV